jgi:hypothetical protein
MAAVLIGSTTKTNKKLVLDQETTEGIIILG